MTTEQALQKIKHYCGYQERCHAEVREKLYSFGLWKKDVEAILSELIEHGFLNEERFAELFAGGKFRMKQWGRVKIGYELKQRKISSYCIKKALQQIDDDAYVTILAKLAATKWKTLKGEKNFFVRKQKTKNYLLQKGFEGNLIDETLSQLTK